MPSSPAYSFILSVNSYTQHTQETRVISTVTGHVQNPVQSLVVYVSSLSDERLSVYVDDCVYLSV
jgi:hypothetical protein